MNRITLFASALLLGLLVAAWPAAGKDTVYTWIDENGVVRYTNTVPPEGATIIETEKEIPHDAEQARQREIEQRQFLERLEREKRTSEAEEAAEREVEKSRSQQAVSGRAEENAEEKASNRSRNRRNETYHQDQIEKRRAQELRRQKFGETPAN